jgi:penicillin-insensitive murein endopeptidase
MIERSAQRVAKRYPGSALDVGDISRKNGGDMNGHHSHESGRDADLGFYAVDAAGKQVHARSFIKFDGSLSSSNHPGARFDLARNWLFIQSLLTDPAARVSHIFIAEPLRQSLLAYARSRGVSKAMWVRAALAMMQPTESLPHDDHIHVRVSCPRSKHDTCIELSKNAPSKATRVARAKRRSRQVTLRTPMIHASHRRGGHTLKNTRAHHNGETRTASAALKTPGVNEPEAEADAIEVKDAIDEIGAVKITD